MVPGVASTDEGLLLASLDAQTQQLVEQVRVTGRPVAISDGGQTVAILVHPDEYQSQLQRLTLMGKIMRGERDHLEGRTYTQEEVEALLDEWLPDDVEATCGEFQTQKHRLALLERIARGRQDIAEGRFHTQEEVEKLMVEWLDVA